MSSSNLLHWTSDLTFHEAVAKGAEHNLHRNVGRGLYGIVGSFTLTSERTERSLLLPSLSRSVERLSSSVFRSPWHPDTSWDMYLPLDLRPCSARGRRICWNSQNLNCLGTGLLREMREFPRSQAVMAVFCLHPQVSDGRRW